MVGNQLTVLDRTSKDNLWFLDLKEDCAEKGQKEFRCLGCIGLRKTLGKLKREQINVFSLLQDEIVVYSNSN